MSEASTRGKEFEKRLAKLIRQKLHAAHDIKAVRNARSGAGEVYKADIDVPGLAWHIEAKSQETIKLREWWRQTVEGCSPYKSPLLVIDDTGHDEWAIMRFSSFLDLVKQVLDDTERIKMLMSQNDIAGGNPLFNRLQKVYKKGNK